MGMSGIYGPAEEPESIATIHTALDAGITLIDTGDFYGMGHNELLIARALKGRDRDGFPLSVKFGAQRGPDGAWLGYDASPAAVKTAAAYSLQRLRTDHIDVYRPARLDANVPIEETIGAIAKLGDPRDIVRQVGELMHHDLRCEPDDRRPQPIRVVDVADHRLGAELAQAVDVGRGPRHPGQGVPGAHQQPDQAHADHAAGPGEKEPQGADLGVGGHQEHRHDHDQLQANARPG